MMKNGCALEYDGLLSGDGVLFEDRSFCTVRNPDHAGGSKGEKR
jgi:hypothetical protein